MKDIYESPFNLRYASREMLYLFSPDKRYSTCASCGLHLLRRSTSLGLPVSEEQIKELQAHIDDIDYEVVAAKEKEIRHDVMAHVYAYGVKCPNAKGIIHLGATSCYVTDNADIIILREALQLIRQKILLVMEKLSEFALEYKALPTLGFTHFQPAQPVTVGKRACLWLHDLLLDLQDVDYVIGSLKLLGSKGTNRHAGKLFEPV